MTDKYLEQKAQKTIQYMSKRQISEYLYCLARAIEDKCGKYNTEYCPAFLRKAGYEIMKEEK